MMPALPITTRENAATRIRGSGVRNFVHFHEDNDHDNLYPQPEKFKCGQ
jgi:hypothetical protein